MPALGDNGMSGGFVARTASRIRGINPQLRQFLIGMALLGIAGGMFETTFNNFLADRFNLSAGARGFLEFPRELPGFLTALTAGALFFMAETLVAAAAALCIGIGMLGLAWWGSGWVPMLAWVTVWSIGSHLIMPVRSSLSMALADPQQRGRRLGQISGVGSAASIIGCGIVWIAMRYAGAGYGFIFITGGVAALCAVVFFARMRMPGAHLQRPKFVWNRRYWLYYVLAFFFGARKQIFITFGPWVLVKVFHQPAYIFAQLWIAAGILGVLSQPLLGRAIDRFGERAVLMTDSVCIFLVCMGYGCAHLLPNHTAALALLYVCFVGDQLLFGVNMARDTYMSKIALKPEHLGPSLSLGITINHAVSMSVPAFGGWLWMQYGHPSVFIATAGIAVLMFIFTSMIRLPRAHGTEPGRPM